VVQHGAAIINRDVSHEPRFARALLDLIPGRKRLAGEAGSLVAIRGAGMRTLRGESLEPSMLHADQSNTSLVFGDQLVLKRPVVVERLRWRRSMAAEEWVYLRARTSQPAKVTLISAQQAAAYYDPEKSKGAYATRDAYLADIVDLTRREITELRRLGCTYIQIDAPQYAALLDPELREGYRTRGSDPDKLIDTCIELDNAIISDYPGMTFGMHICRGNNQSRFYAQGDYGPIARIFQRTKFNRFLLEYDDQRSGGFEPLRHVPHDRFVVLGLVTTKKPELEGRDHLEARLEEAARFFPRDRLALSPQCGFASTLAGNRITPNDQRKKLELVAQTARRVWGSAAAAASR